MFWVEGLGLRVWGTCSCTAGATKLRPEFPATVKCALLSPTVASYVNLPPREYEDLKFKLNARGLVLISQEVFTKSFRESEFPHETVILSFVVTHVN